MRQPTETNAQVAFKGVMEATKDKAKELLDPKLKEVYSAALDWAMARLNPATPTAQKPLVEPAKSKSEPLKPADGSLVFKDAGELKNYLKDELKMNGLQIGAATAGHILTTDEGLRNCWASILKTREGTNE